HLKELDDHPEIYDQLAEKSAYLKKKIGKVLEKAAIDHTVNQCGSMLSVNFSAQPVTDFESAKACDQNRFKDFFQGMLTNGVYIAPSVFETWFVTNALTQNDLEATVTAVERTVKSW